MCRFEEPLQKRERARKREKVREGDYTALAYRVLD